MQMAKWALLGLALVSSCGISHQEQGSQSAVQAQTDMKRAQDKRSELVFTTDLIPYDVDSGKGAVLFQNQLKDALTGQDLTHHGIRLATQQSCSVFLQVTTIGKNTDHGIRKGSRFTILPSQTVVPEVSSSSGKPTIEKYSASFVLIDKQNPEGKTLHMVVMANTTIPVKQCITAGGFATIE